MNVSIDQRVLAIDARRSNEKVNCFLLMRFCAELFVQSGNIFVLLKCDRFHKYIRIKRENILICTVKTSKNNMHMCTMVKVLSKE